MNISSKYFQLLERPNSAIIKHFFNFLISAHRVGKFSELFSFAWWEICHQFQLFPNRKYLKFTDDAYLSITKENNRLPEHNTEFLLREGVYFKQVEVDWKNCIEVSDGSIWGIRYSQPNGLYHSVDGSMSSTLIYESSNPITSLYISKSGSIFICSNGIVYKSSNCGVCFEAVLKLSSEISYFLFNYGMTELPDQTLMIGEYGSIWHGTRWQNLAFLYYSTNGGNTWITTDFIQQQGANKHIHIVKYSERLKSLVLTDGDNKKRIWLNSDLAHFDKRISRKQTGWKLINRFHHQTGGYLSMAETKDTVHFGSDYLGGTNFVVSTNDGQLYNKLLVPDPYRRSPISNLTTRQTPKGNEIWAFSHSGMSASSRSLLMCSKDDGKTWARIIDYDGTKDGISLVSSSQVPYSMLYISIISFGDTPDSLHHRIYKLMNNHNN